MNWNVLTVLEVKEFLWTDVDVQMVLNSAKKWTKRKLLLVKEIAQELSLKEKTLVKDVNHFMLLAIIVLLVRNFALREMRTFSVSVRNVSLGTTLPLINFPA